MKKLLHIVAIALTCALTGTPRASGQSAQFVYSNLSGNPTPGSSFSFDITLNFTAGGSIANLNGLSYWMYQVTSPGGGFNLVITLRSTTGSLFTDLQSTSLTYPQNLDPINRNANGTQNNTDLGALSGNSLPSGSYFIAHITIFISANALPGMYTIGNTTAATPGVGGRISVMSDDQGTTFPIASSAVNVTVTAIPTPTPTPIPTATPTPTSINISGTISYCSNPVPHPVPNVMLTLTGNASGSTLSDGSGNYQLSSLAPGGSYIVTPTKPALVPASAGINTTDVIAVQRHFLVLGTPLSGCRLTAADVNASGTINTTDVIAIQRFFLGFTTGIANTGKYKFTPVNRAYLGLVTNQTAQNYDTLIFGDVASPFAELLDSPSQTAAGNDASPGEVPATVATLSLPNVAVDAFVTNFVVQVTTTTIDGKNRLVGFQGDFTFDERMVTFQEPPVQNAGLTAGNWNVSGNVLPGTEPIRTLRISAFSLDFTPLSGSGTLFELRMRRISTAAQGTELIWAAPPDNFIFIDADLNTQKPGNAAPGSIGSTPLGKRK